MSPCAKDDVPLREEPEDPVLGIMPKVPAAGLLEKKSVADASAPLPLYRRGGMHLNNVLGAINAFGPLILLLSVLPEDQIKAFVAVLVGCIGMAALTKRTVYCVLVMPSYMMSMILCLTLRVDGYGSHHIFSYACHPVVFLLVAVALAIGKVNICMSVCLHRYAAHHAFKCGPITSFIVNILGCLANQGGPIWWASQHRCHHKHCDVERDPHSPLISGTEKAFAFFLLHEDVEEEFAPRHLEGTSNRILDTWAWAIVSVEWTLAYASFGREGLFLAYTSGWICQSITLWFNIANHPPDEAQGEGLDCKAADGRERGPDSYFIPFHFLDRLSHLFGVFVMEGEHKHHHDHSTLAKRSWYDIAYWFFIKPLEQAGLVWDVHV